MIINVMLKRIIFYVVKFQLFNSKIMVYKYKIVHGIIS